MLVFRKECTFGARETKFCFQPLKFTSQVTLVKVLHFSVLQLTYIVNKDNTALCDERTLALKLIDIFCLGDINAEMKYE